VPDQIYEDGQTAALGNRFLLMLKSGRMVRERDKEHDVGDQASFWAKFAFFRTRSINSLPIAILT